MREGANGERLPEERWRVDTVVGKEWDLRVFNSQVADGDGGGEEHRGVWIQPGSQDGPGRVTKSSTNTR